MPRYSSRAMGKRLFNQQPLHLLALGPGLVGDKLHAQHLASEVGGLFGRLGNLHATAFAAASGVNLRLDDHSGRAFVEELPGRSIGFVAGFHHLPARHRHSVLRQDGFSLVLVNFHICMMDTGELARYSGPAGRIVCSAREWLQNETG